MSMVPQSFSVSKSSVDSLLFKVILKTQPYDCHYFAAFYLFLNLLILCWTKSALYIHLSAYVFTLAALIVVGFKLYPRLINTIYDLILILSISLAGFWYSFHFTAISLDTFHSSQKDLVIVGLLLSIPALYAVLYYLYRQAMRKLIINCKTLIDVNQERNEAMDGSNREMSSQYGTKNEHTSLLSQSH